MKVIVSARHWPAPVLEGELQWSIGVLFQCSHTTIAPFYPRWTFRRTLWYCAMQSVPGWCAATAPSYCAHAASTRAGPTSPSPHGPLLKSERAPFLPPLCWYGPSPLRYGSILPILLATLPVPARACHEYLVGPASPSPHGPPLNSERAPLPPLLCWYGPVATAISLHPYQPVTNLLATPH